MEGTVRSRSLVVSGVLATAALAATLIGAPPALAVGTATFTQNGSSITVTYAGFSGVASLAICPTSTSALLCDPTTASYVLDSNVGTALPASPASLSAGLTVRTGSGGSFSLTTLAAGTYNLNLTDLGTHVSMARMTSGVIGSGGSGGSGCSDSSGSAPAPILQEFGMPTTSSCDDNQPANLNWANVSSGGWGQSWSQWMNGGTGGFVCTRTLVYSTNLDHWIVS